MPLFGLDGCQIAPYWHSNCAVQPMLCYATRRTVLAQSSAQRMDFFINQLALWAIYLIFCLCAYRLVLRVALFPVIGPALLSSMH